MFKILQVFFLATMFSHTLMAENAINKFINTKGFENASISLSIINTDNNREIASYNKNLSLVPASILKSLTTATFLSAGQPDFKFSTEVGFNGEINNGVLNGNLIIKGSGDPTLISPKGKDPEKLFTETISFLKEKGVKKISGNIIADDTYLNQEPVAPGWTWEDMGNYYAAGIYGLNFNDNQYSLTFDTSRKNSKPAIISVSPQMKNLDFINNLSSRNMSYDSAYIYGAPYSKERFIVGAIPHSKNTYTIKGDIPDPAKALAETFLTKLSETGITVESGTVTGYELLRNGKKIPAIKYPVTTIKSEPVSQIIKEINFNSNNLYAEGILRLIGVSHGDNTLTSSIETLKNIWKEKGFNTSGLFMYDGSGLSPYNKVNADFMTQMLSYMKENKSFVNSLPIAGKEGTVKNFLKSPEFKGTAKLKSGSLKQVIAYCGYIYTNNNYAVTIIVNNYTCPPSRVRMAIEKLLIDLNL